MTNDHLLVAGREWVGFGREAFAPNPNYSKVQQRFRDTYGWDLQSGNSTIVDDLAQRILSGLSPNERRCLGKLDVRQVQFDSPDARALSLRSAGLVGVDLGLLLMVQNLTTILFSTDRLFILGLLESFGGIQQEAAIKLARERLETFFVGGAAALEEFDLIPDVQRLVVATRFLDATELFIVAHELGHVALARAEESTVGRLPVGHSFLQGMKFFAGTQPDMRGQEPDRTRRVRNWAGEIAADRWAVRLLRRLYASMPAVWCDAVLYFVFHFIDVVTAMVVVEQGAKPVDHPLPFVRLQACGIPTHLAHAHVKYSSSEPFATIQYVLDMLRWRYELQDHDAWRGYLHEAVEIYEPRTWEATQVLVARIESEYTRMLTR